MVHRELLTVLLVCCLGLSLVAAQPALAGDDSGTSMFFEENPDGLSDEDSKDETSEEDDTSDGNDEETDSDDSDGESGDSADDGWGTHDDSDDENATWGEGSGDDRRWGERSDNESDDENSSDYGEGMGDSDAENESEEGAENDSDADARDEQMDGSSEGTADDESDGEGDTENSSARANGTSDRFLLDDVANVLVEVADVRPNATAKVTDASAGVTGAESGDARSWTVDRDGDGDADDASLRPSAGFDRSFGEGDLGGTLDATTGVEELVTYLSSESVLVSNVVAVLAEPSTEDGDDRLSTDGYEGAADGESLHPLDRAGTLDSSSPADPSVDGASDDETADEAEAAGGSSGGDGGEGPSGAPAGGAALLMFVGYLGGGRLALNQTAMLASTSQSNLLATFHQSLGHHLGRLPDGVVPPVFGYSRHDDSDPLENETRARIYDLVRDSPGMYYAQLAEETDVTVETVRYHCRILADEGLVERRKLRGRQRLYPVTMGDDDPELAAAIADSAASDVLSAIERREPTTLSSVAEAIGCAPSTVSYHLDRLEEDGLVSRERDGGSVRIRLRRATKSALQGSVADD